MAKLNVIVLQGGESQEHEVSLNTARQIIANLDKEKYDVRTITITKDGRWLLESDNVLINSSVENETALGAREASQTGGGRRPTTAILKKMTLQKECAFDQSRILESVKAQNADIVFIALHGGAGEDGRIQSLLELVGLPYIGSPPLASGLAMNKVRSAEIYRANGLHVPFSFHFNNDVWGEQKDFVLESINRMVAGPWIVKPADQGSSIGITVVSQKENLPSAIDNGFEYTNTIIVQQFIAGVEATCGILEREDGEPVLLPPTRIVPRAGAFYDYNSKYLEGGSEHICPADFASQLNLEIQHAALTAHRALGCTGMSRTDFIVGDDGVLYVLETNTIPGMTPTSLLPEAALKAGIDFPKLLDMLITRGLSV